MKRTLIAIAVALVAASGANAATMSIDTDKSTYNVGELITITATLTIAAAGDVADSAAGTAISLEASWDPTTGFVANGALPGNYGTSSQIVTVGPLAGGSNLSSFGGGAPCGSNLSSFGGGAPWIGGSPNGCVSAGAGAGNTCILISQSLFSAFAPDDPQTLVGTLVLEASALGSLGLVVASAAYLGGGITGPSSVTVGSNFASAAVVPEPTTAAMLGLGLLGLSVAGRRRRS
jgi:hypothetical protein